ncbi:hypothetical protein AK812_SmicGene48997, partial [Symbiodinium microadriaticum]
LFLAPAPAAAPGKRQARRAHPSARSPEAPLLSAGACLHLRATPALDQQLPLCPRSPIGVGFLGI